MTPHVRLRYRGSLRGAPRQQIANLIERSAEPDEGVALTVSSVLEAVRAGGDATLRAIAREMNGVNLERIEVDRARCQAALDQLSPVVRSALEQVLANLEAVNRASLPQPVEVEVMPGVFVGRRPDPLQRVGLHLPGGQVSRASTVLMMAVPARVAGVREVILCCAPESGGMPPEQVLAAAELARVDRVFAIGGPAAIAAMAFGTPTVPRVDRIVGPGDAYVVEAKRQVSGFVSTDAGSGATELLVVVDDAADVHWVAGEVVAVARSDPDSLAVVLAVGEAIEARLLAALSDAVRKLPAEGNAILGALADSCVLLTVNSSDEAFEFVNAFAPQQLLLAVRRAEEWLPSVRNAGLVFTGGSSLVSASFASGANLLLPKDGLARFWSGLSSDSFLRWTSTERVTEEGMRALAGTALTLAELEGIGSSGVVFPRDKE
jgi:histidinol dehydrogenase